MLKKFSKLFHYILITLIIIACGANAFYSYVHMMKQLSKNMVPLEPGSQFAGFRPYLTHTEFVGYTTNKSMSPDKNDGTFLQAQYFLAPSILKLNETDHRFVIIDSTNQQYIVPTLTDLRREGPADMVTYNEYGQALIKRTSL